MVQSPLTKSVGHVGWLQRRLVAILRTQQRSCSTFVTLTILSAIEAINYAGEFAAPLHGSGSKKSADEGAISEKPFDIENG